MKKQISVENLKLDMYVCELDRPWLGTQYLFQGFTLESSDQIDELQRCCEYVFIDITKGADFAIRQEPVLALANQTSNLFVTNVTQSVKPPHTVTTFSGEATANNGNLSIKNKYAYSNKTTVKEELGKAIKARNNAQILMAGLMDDIRKERALDANKVEGAVNEMVESIIRNPDALLLLTQLREKNTASFGQAIDLAVYLIAFGRHLSYPKAYLGLLGMGGLLQDIGKLRLPEELLEEKIKYTDDEYALSKTHVLHSVDILKNTPGIVQEVIEMVDTHHERQDGSGYPHGFNGANIKTFGSMAAIVDTFIALTRERNYAPAVSPREALEIMSAWRGKYLHSGLLERFIQCIGVYPIGSLVELNTGEVAVVLTQSRVHHFKPKVIRILDINKKPYKNPSMLDLYTDPLTANQEPYQIRKSLEYGMYGIDPKEYYL